MAKTQPRVAVLFDETRGTTQPPGKEIEQSLPDLRGIAAMHVAHFGYIGFAQHQIIEAVDHAP